MSLVVIFFVHALTIAAMYYLRAHGHAMHWLWVWGPAVALFVSIGAFLLIVFSMGHNGLLKDNTFSTTLAWLIAMMPVPLTLIAVWVKLVRILL